MNETQNKLTEALYELHSAAMDAMNDPSPTTLQAVGKAYRKVSRLTPPFYAERYRQPIDARAVSN